MERHIQPTPSMVRVTAASSVVIGETVAAMKKSDRRAEN